MTADERKAATTAADIQSANSYATRLERRVVELTDSLVAAQRRIQELEAGR